ncbi:MAG: response regulator transcription factor, partial [Acidobacteriota bacterium]
MRIESSSLTPNVPGAGQRSSSRPTPNVQAKKHSNSQESVKILIADREGVFRLGLKKLFSVEDDLRVVAQAENPSQLLAMAKSFKPDLLIVQQQIVLDGCEDLLQQLRRQVPGCRAIVTGTQSMEDATGKLLSRGVAGIISRSASPETFIEGVRKIITGDPIPLSEPESREMEPGGADAARPQRPVDTLTRRERTVISCLAQGWRNREIAQHLTITEQTVKNH